jgi:hypothetical protein
VTPVTLSVLRVVYIGGAERLERHWRRVDYRGASGAIVNAFRDLVCHANIQTDDKPAKILLCCGYRARPLVKERGKSI